jgi:Protein of unknown function (DUF2934)
MMPRSARRKTDNVLTMPSVESPPVGAIGLAGVTDNDIARRAFELYCDRGREDGHDVDDWLNAERELRDVSSSSAA